MSDASAAKTDGMKMIIRRIREGQEKRPIAVMKMMGMTILNDNGTQKTVRQLLEELEEKMKNVR